MKKAFLYAMGCGALVLTLPAVHADTEPGAASIHEFSGNAMITSDYLFRGMSQTDEEIAIQGGFDYRHVPSGFYLGTWASSVEFTTNDIDNSSVEWDFYGGIAGEFSGGVSWDVGGIYYYYPGQDEDHAQGVYNYDCLEVYAGLGYTFENNPLQPTVGVKLWYSGDYFGENGNSLYSEGSLDLVLPRGFGLGFHVGRIDADGDNTAGSYDYTHWSVGLSREVIGFGLDLSYNDAGNDGACTGNDLCQAVVFSVSRNF